MRSILVVAAHADDEVIGCGATIARHVAEGDSVHVLIMADGVGSRQGSTAENIRTRRSASCAVQLILGVATVTHLEFPDNQMDSVPLLEIVRQVEIIIDRIKPSIVYTHHHGDLNVDHRMTHQAVMTACRPLPLSPVAEIYGFEVLSSTEWSINQPPVFSPTLFVDVSKYLKIKLKALECYAEEMRNIPHSRSIRHIEVLAEHRGYCNGRSAAEAFHVYRIIR